MNKSADNSGVMPKTAVERGKIAPYKMGHIAVRTSRLACQITLTAELDGLKVRIPGESRNMQGL